MTHLKLFNISPNDSYFRLPYQQINQNHMPFFSKEIKSIGTENRNYQLVGNLNCELGP